jgi:phage head maturation protease
MSDTRVCGYAIVYNEPVLYEDGATTYMTVEPDAFTDALRDGVQQVPLLWRSHNGPVVGHANALWSDSYGLAFSARIDAAHENKIGSITRGNDPLNRCSVNMLIAYDGEAMSTHLGQKLRCVHRSSLDHIAVGLPAGGAAYNGTALWVPSMGMEDAPTHIQDLAAHWHVGFVAHQTAQIDAALARSSSRGTASVSPGADLAPSDRARLHQLLAARQAAHSAVQRGFAMALGGIGPRGSSVIAGHAALGRGFGASQMYAAIKAVRR